MRECVVATSENSILAGKRTGSSGLATTMTGTKRVSTATEVPDNNLQKAYQVLKARQFFKALSNLFFN